MLEYFKVRPEDLGWLTIEDAWEEVGLHCRNPGYHGWSKGAVYMAGRITGWFQIANCDQFDKQRLEKKFTQEYERLAHEVFIGMTPEPEQLLENQENTLGKAGDEKLGKIMEIQGIDPAMSGADARKKLLSTLVR